MNLVNNKTYSKQLLINNGVITSFGTVSIPVSLETNFSTVNIVKDGYYVPNVNTYFKYTFNSDKYIILAQEANSFGIIGSSSSAGADYRQNKVRIDVYVNGTLDFQHIITDYLNINGAFTPKFDYRTIGKYIPDHSNIVLIFTTLEVIRVSHSVGYRGTNVGTRFSDIQGLIV